MKLEFLKVKRGSGEPFTFGANLPRDGVSFETDTLIYPG
jgi:hypothetical protein